MDNVPWFSLLTMVTLSATLSLMSDAQDCFGGIETFEKMVSMTFSGVVSYKSMLNQPGQAITRDCINLCKQQAACLSFGLNYTTSSCVSYNVNSVGRGDDLITTTGVNFFEKICFRGVSKQVFDSACRDRLWVFDRVRDAYLDGHVDKELKNIRTKEDCEKLCITEERFRCRSADYDEVQHICRMSRETRRTKPTSFRRVPGSMRNYLENQCAPPPPGTCRYETKQDLAVLAPDYLQFAATAADCMGQCDAETAFNCWSYSYLDNRCQLSGDSSDTVGKGVEMPSQAGAVYGEMSCFFEQCDNGVMTFEKMTGTLLRSAQGTVMPVTTPGSLGNTLECLKFCLDEGMECPAFSDHYQNMRCDRLDRNSNGRTQELVARDGENYFEKICLQGPEAQGCSEKAWAFERALGYELAENLYRKTISKVETRRECIQLCLGEREFTCRSARYDEDTGECKLSSSDRRRESGKYFKSENARVSYLENSCLPVEILCPYIETQDAYATYTNVIQTYEITSLESCREFCTNYQKFPCRSFSFYSSSLQCFVSGDDKASGGSAALQRRPGIIYFERMCPLIPVNEATTTEAVTTDEATSTTQRIPTPTTERYIEKGTTTLRPRPSYQPQEPSRPECSPTERLIFEKLTGYEPFGITSTLLYRGDSTTPGITAECVRRCQALADCRSFVLDHQRYECSSIQDPPVVHPSDFRAAIGKTFFGGICVPAYIGCSKLWVYERIMDHELQGIPPLDVIRVVSLEQCQQHCLETRKYVCRSANYYHLRRECHIFGDDRSAAKSQLERSSRVDYMENQCLVDSSYCPYQKSEPDLAMIYVTKSLMESPSTLHCERECNREREFNCRSYTFWDLGGATKLCLLSGESRLTGQAVGLQYRQGATFASKMCKSPSESRQVPTLFPPYPATMKATAAPVPTAARTTLPPFKPVPPPTHPTPTPLRPLPRAICSYDKYTYEKVVGHEIRIGRKERIPTRSPIGVLNQCNSECQRLGERCRGFIIQYKSYQNCYLLDGMPGDNSDSNDLSPSSESVYFEKICLRERTCGKMWTFERVLNHELHTEAVKEVGNVLQRSDCEDLCLREGSLCHSATYHYHTRLCRIYSDTRRSKPNQFHYSNDEVDYLENQCISDPPTCQYRDFPDRFLPTIDRLSRAFSLQDCQRQCDTERQFTCRSVNYETVARDCALSSEDTSSAAQGINTLQLRRNSLYSEKGNCEQVTVQCNQQDMLLTIHFNSPFNGRVYAKSNPRQCTVVGTGQTTLQFAVSLGTKCGTREEPNDRYVNEVVVQEHPVIMTDHDRTIKVVCSFETQERTYTMSGPGVGLPGMDVGRTHNQLPSIVTNTAPPPNVGMRVLDASGRDAQAVGLGDELTLKIELREKSSAFAIFARNLYARSSNGESLFLIDSTGCPTDESIFPALQIDPNDRKSLYSTFKAFRFPSTGMVNFEVQIRFCQEKCEQARCGSKGASYGRKKRNAGDGLQSSSSTSGESLLDDEDVYFDHGNYDSLDSVIKDKSQSILMPSPNNYDDYTSENRNEAGENEEGDVATTEKYISASTIHSLPTTVYGYFKDDSLDSTDSSNPEESDSSSELEGNENDGFELFSAMEKSSTISSELMLSADSDSKDPDDEISSSISQGMPSESVTAQSTISSTESSTFEKSLESDLSTSTERKRTIQRLSTNSYSSSFSSESPSVSTETSDRIPSEDLTLYFSSTIKQSLMGDKSLSKAAGSTTTESNREQQTKRNAEIQNPILMPTASRLVSASKSPATDVEYSDSPREGEEKSFPSFSRKFAFINPDDGNSTGHHTPNSETARSSMNLPLSWKENKTEDKEENKDAFRSFPRPDARGFGEPQVSGLPPSQPKPFGQDDKRWPPFSHNSYSAANRPMSMPGNRGFESSSRNRDQHLPPLTPFGPRPFEIPSSPGGWGAAPLPPASLHHPQHHPSFQSRPIEILSIPGGWNSHHQTNRDSSSQHHISEGSVSVNDKDDDRQGKVVGPPAPFNQNPMEIRSSPQRWGSNSPHSPIQIQRPLEVIDDPSRRRDPPGFFPTGHHSSHPRPVEIPNVPDGSQNPVDRSSNNRPPNAYDFHSTRNNGRQIPGSKPNPAHPMEITINSNSWSNGQFSTNNNNPPQRPDANPQNGDININSNPWSNGQRFSPNNNNSPQRPDVNPQNGDRWHQEPQPFNTRESPTRQSNQLHGTRGQPSPPGHRFGQPPQSNFPRREDQWRETARQPPNSRPGERGGSFPPYPPRPNEVVATTQKSVPEEVPLSLAILVGEDGKPPLPPASPHQRQHEKSQPSWRPNPNQFNRGLQRHNIINTPRPEEPDDTSADKVCTSKSTVIATAISVTLVYLGVVAAAVVIYRWYRKNKRRKEMASNPIHFPPNPTSANVTYSTPDVTFRNVYGNFPVSSTSTS